MADEVTAEVTDLLQHLIRNACVNDGTVESGQEARAINLGGFEVREEMIVGYELNHPIEGKAGGTNVQVTLDASRLPSSQVYPGMQQPLNLIPNPLTLSGSVAPLTGPFQVAFSNGPNRNSEWVGLFPQGSTGVTGYVDWQWMTGGQSLGGTAPSSGVAGWGAPVGRSPVWAIRTPIRIRAAPTSWIGASTSWSRSAASVTITRGSIVLASAACAAPIRRAPA